MIKKIFIIVVALGLLAFAGVKIMGYIKYAQLPTTDLSQISVNSIKLGDNISEIDTEEFKVTSLENSEDPVYISEYIYLDPNSDGVITEILAVVNNGDANVQLTINNSTDFHSIDDIAPVLGDNYNDSVYDKEQNLREHEYIDKDNNIAAHFVYDVTGSLIWVILETI